MQKVKKAIVAAILLGLIALGVVTSAIQPKPVMAGDPTPTPTPKFPGDGFPPPVGG